MINLGELNVAALAVVLAAFSSGSGLAADRLLAEVPVPRAVAGVPDAPLLSFTARPSASKDGTKA